MARPLLIVNPRASRVTPPLVEQVAAALGGAEVLRTERPGHATELVRAAAGEVERIYVFSGDGGFNEALNGAGPDTPLGFLPGGGTSVLARALGLPRDPLAAARALVTAEPRRISVGRVNGRRFGFAAGLGFDAELVRLVDALGRAADGRRPGDRAFFREAVRVLRARRFRLEPRIAVRGVGRAAFVLVANGSPYTYAGPFPVRVAAGARFELGLDLAAPRSVSAWSLPLLAAAAALPGLAALPRVHRLHDAGRIEATADEPMPLQADGEDLGDARDVVWEAERGAVLVLAPARGRRARGSGV